MPPPPRPKPLRARKATWMLEQDVKATVGDGPAGKLKDCGWRTKVTQVTEGGKFSVDFLPSTQYGCFQKWGYPKMDGENNGQSY